ncbi:hypothetical protein NEISUBOT_04354 [Neisseria subflava NJ9703]|uniref:Uncharacterized protein n=1 Tax=Neisseria subflava NJ9703 TaxID=546268 RepID=A0A9W5MZC6_NEISU|nr:hypothetical protein NEISUBOT_04354 [Neisseria subflava NJ9703]
MIFIKIFKLQIKMRPICSFTFICSLIIIIKIIRISGQFFIPWEKS